MTVFEIALGGLNRAEAVLERAAGRLARPPLALDGEPPQDCADLSAEMVALLEARNHFQINARVLRAAAEMERHLLDVLG